MTPEEKQPFKAALEKEKKKLEAMLSQVANRDPNDKNSLTWDPSYPQMGESDDRGSSAMEESADEVEEYELRIESGETMEGRLRDVSRALETIETDAYGKCETCGTDIPLERLRANPAARFDIEHAS